MFISKKELTRLKESIATLENQAFINTNRYVSFCEYILKKEGFKEHSSPIGNFEAEFYWVKKDFKIETNVQMGIRYWYLYENPEDSLKCYLGEFKDILKLIERTYE